MNRQIHDLTTILIRHCVCRLEIILIPVSVKSLSLEPIGQPELGLRSETLT